MLDLLLAADRAATTPERQDLLEGVMQNDDRLVRRAMESTADHGDLLGDDFFWAFMGLAMNQGSAAVWRVLGDWGYSLQSQVRTPPQDGPSSATTLGCWGATFVPVDRLDWLEKRGWFDPGSTVHEVGNGHARLNAMEVGMLNGTPEHFDHWLVRWRAAQTEVWAKHQRQRGGAPRFFVPAVVVTAMGLERLSEQGRKPVQGGEWDTPAEARRRKDALIETWLSVHCPHVPTDRRLEALSRNPPFALREAGREVLTALATWQIEREAAPFEAAVELVALEGEHLDWVYALLQAGAPLDRPTVTLPDGSALAAGLAQAYAHRVRHRDEDDVQAAVGCFLERARTHAPAARAMFFCLPAVVASPKNGKGRGRGVVFACLHDHDADGVAQLLAWGCPLDLKDRSGTGGLLPQRLATALLAAPFLGLNAEAKAQNWVSWARRAAEEDPGLLPWSWATHGHEPVEFQAHQAGLFALLEQMIDHGLPLSRQNREGHRLGWVMLVHAARGGRLDLGAWDAFRERALAQGDPSVDVAYLHQTAPQIEAAFALDPRLALTTLQAQRLDARWNPATAVPKPRPRL